MQCRDLDCVSMKDQKYMYSDKGSHESGGTWYPLEHIFFYLILCAILVKLYCFLKSQLQNESGLGESETVKKINVCLTRLLVQPEEPDARALIIAPPFSNNRNSGNSSFMLKKNACTVVPFSFV